MNGIELDAIWRPSSGGSPQMVTIVGFEHVAHGTAVLGTVSGLRAVAVPMKGGIPFSAPASEFEVKDKAYREP
jgi:hypothetical protein